ncbi:hypothetical protein VTO58DRAFT_106713 [Aureobasidium pullulans]
MHARQNTQSANATSALNFGHCGERRLSNYWCWRSQIAATITHAKPFDLSLQQYLYCLSVYPLPPFLRTFWLSTNSFRPLLDSKDLLAPEKISIVK